MARSEIGLSEALAGAGDYAGAIEAATDGRREAVGIENDDVLWRALTAEARAIRRLGDRPRALGVSRDPHAGSTGGGGARSSGVESAG